MPRGVAGTTRLELATSAVTGQRSNQLNYVPKPNEERQTTAGCTLLAAAPAKHQLKLDSVAVRPYEFILAQLLEPANVDTAYIADGRAGRRRPSCAPIALEPIIELFPSPRIRAVGPSSVKTSKYPPLQAEG